jgi:rhodanese-related sulfurtransferase
MGFQAVSFEGGLEAWAAAGQPIVGDDGRPGRLV